MPNYSTPLNASSIDLSSDYVVRTIDPDERKDLSRQLERWQYQEDATDIRINRATLRTPLVYIDMACDHNAGVILSQLMYWYGKDRKGRQRIANPSKGLAKAREEWWDECRLTLREVDAAITILKTRQRLYCLSHDNKLVWREPLIRVSYHRFNGERVTHIKPIVDNILATWECVGARLKPPRLEAYAFVKKARAKDKAEAKKEKDAYDDPFA